MENNEIENKHIRVILSKEQAESKNFELEHTIDEYDFINYYPNTRQAELPVIGGGTAIMNLIPKNTTQITPSDTPKPNTQEEKIITNFFDLTYGGEEEGLYKHVTFSGHKGDVIHLWDYIKDLVSKDSDGKYYFTVNGYVYKNSGDLDDGTTLETKNYTLNVDDSGESVEFRNYY